VFITAALLSCMQLISDKETRVLTAGTNNTPSNYVQPQFFVQAVGCNYIDQFSDIVGYGALICYVIHRHTLSLVVLLLGGGERRAEKRENVSKYHMFLTHCVIHGTFLSAYFQW
jgi:hypothetical protein